MITRLLSKIILVVKITFMSFCKFFTSCKVLVHCRCHSNQIQNPSPDSEKCSIPALDVPLFPYSWSAYPGSDLRHLGPGPYPRLLRDHRRPLSQAGIHAEDGGGEFYAQRGCFQDAEQLDVKTEIKSENHFVHPNLDANETYKCIKCCKVGFYELCRHKLVLEIH